MMKTESVRAGGGTQYLRRAVPPAKVESANRLGISWAAASASASKLAAAARMMVVPDVTPTMWPALSTVATPASLLDHTNATLGMGCESAGPSMRHARAVAMVSSPRNKMRIEVMLTCTEA